MASKKTSTSGNTETLLVELLTEELPPKALREESEFFGHELRSRLEKERFVSSTGSKLTTYATPRRLSVLIESVQGRSPDLEREVQGPSVSAPAQAVEGFAKKCGVATAALKKQQTPKGEIYVARMRTSGNTLDAALGAVVEATLKALPVPKMMRWGDGEARFVRPVHGLVMMHGARVVPGEVLGRKSSNQTLGHRFLSSGRITIKHAGDYEQALLKGMVVAGYETRQEIIINKLNKLCGSSATPVASSALYGEIAALVEAPEAYAGEFSPAFLEVPEECLILSMQQHQKYVPLRDKATGKLLPRFLFVSNIAAGNPREIIHGNERVLRARLSDARFFYDQDRKTRLETRVPLLAKVVYHNKLGSQLERAERIQLLAGRIARDIGADPLLAERAAWLSKADLLTEMVGEFPELQGTMGRYYALHDREPQTVADAIEAHYRPRFAGDKLPESSIACAVALADKLDAVAGLFSIGQQPTGDRDPFGLRRAALGIVRIVVENKLPLSLLDLADTAFEPFKSKAPVELVKFVNDRFAGYLKDLGFSTLQVDAVLSANRIQPSLVPKQLEAVKAFQALPEAESLAAANKRVVNILKQAEAKGESFANVEPSELMEPAERALHEAIRSTSERAKVLFDRGDYAGYLTTFSVLKAPVDAFFDSVMVMVDDPKLRRGRLALLRDLREAMNRVADISKLAA